jgi:hypothetical protein
LATGAPSFSSDDLTLVSLQPCQYVGIDSITLI